MDTLDALDRRVLYELDRNASQSLSELARKIRQGRDRVEYRVERLIERKIIKRFTASVNLYRLGFTIFKSYLRLENDKARVAEFVSYLRTHPRVYWLALCDGSWDLIFAVFARNPLEFHEIHSSILSKFNPLVLNFSSYTLVDLRIYNRTYLANRGGEFVIVGGPPEDVEIDQLDFSILKLLSKDARQAASEMAEKLDVSPQVVRYRIDRLERQQIITGYRIDLDLARLNMLFFKTQFFLRNYQLSLRQQLRDIAAANPNITSYIEQIGDCNVELELEVNDYAQYSRIIDEIRGEHSKLVRNFQSMLVRKFYFNWVPEDMPGLVERERRSGAHAIE